MLNKSDDNTRRILNFPAIRPCESVSFSILLSSLLDLGRRICSFKSRTFFTSKKNAHTSIHLIETLIVFLEEIPKPNQRSELSMVLCLSELHFVFQKIHFLLEDCSRDDSRLWMLSKSEKSATHFRILVRAIAVALDVLPLGELEVVDEVKELVEFVRKQGLRIDFELGKDDWRAMIRVSRILEKFERGIVPESSDLKRVLDYLGISSWNVCNREIKFLENEIGQECSNTEKRESGFLSSLTALMIFCRCTVFTNIEKNSVVRQSGGGGAWSSGPIRCLNPDDFKCPITLEIMIDPVTIATGHTYDRSSILKWFTCGNHTCPKTGEKLKSLDLVPNLAVKRIVKKYLQENGIPYPQSDRCNKIRSLLSGAGSPAADQAINMATHFLVGRLFSGTEQEQSKAAYEIRLLTKTSNFNRSCLVESHAIPRLLTVIVSINPEGQENAAAALLNLSKHPQTKILLSQSAALDQIIDLLQNGLKIEARQHAAGVLFYLSSVEENRRKIGRIAIPGLMGLLDNGPARGKKNALVTILALLMYHENHWRVLSGGVVLMVVNLLTSCERDDLITDCLAVLAILAEKIEGAMAIVSSGGVSVILEILSSSASRAAKEHCVSLLLALCVNDGVDVVPILVKNQSLIVTLYSLLAGGSTRSSRKASSLIRILHGFNEKSSNGSTMVASGLAQEQSVHVW